MLITDICGQPKQQLDIRSLRLSEELQQEAKTVVIKANDHF